MATAPTARRRRRIYVRGPAVFHELLQQQPDRRPRASRRSGSDADGIARPVAALGRANDWKLLKRDAFAARWPAGVEPKATARNAALFRLVATERRRRVQPDEVQIDQGAAGGVTVAPDLSFLVVARRRRTRCALRRTIHDAGVPVYDLAARRDARQRARKARRRRAATRRCGTTTAGRS